MSFPKEFVPLFFLNLYIYIYIYIYIIHILFSRDFLHYVECHCNVLCVNQRQTEPFTYEQTCRREITRSVQVRVYVTNVYISCTDKPPPPTHTHTHTHTHTPTPPHTHPTHTHTHTHPLPPLTHTVYE